jgi:hypothetical protein
MQNCNPPNNWKIKAILALNDSQLLQLRIQTRDFDAFVGIDPGVKTGLALWDKPFKELREVRTVSIHKGLNLVEDILGRYHKERILVRVEDARLRNWIPKEKNNSQYRGRLMGAGSVMRDSLIWEEFLTDLAITFEMVAPAAGRSKWSETYFKSLTKWPGVTSNHARDAAALVYGL